MSPFSPESHSDASLGEPPAKKRRGVGETTPAANTSIRRQEACRPCRLRKVKCDKQRPGCAMCDAKGLDCELQDATTAILSRLDQLREEVHGVKQVLRAGGTSSGPRWSFAGDAQPTAETSPMTPPQTTTTSSSSSSIPAAESIGRSNDFLRIPPHRASADSVLEWDIFQQKYPPNALVGVLFGGHRNDSSSPEGTTSTTATRTHDFLQPDPPATSNLALPDQELIPSLIDRFLQNVHTKNPILDVESLVKHGRRCADQGVDWTASSCLVLLACALGSVAKPFGEPDVHVGAPDYYPAPLADRDTNAPSSARVYARELRQGDAYFTLACRRLGSLQYSLLGSQCHFFAGVYLMYTLRPVQSWHYFHHASIFCHLYLRMTYGLASRYADVVVIDSTPSRALGAADRKARRLEQSLYWSCFKSECEYRVEFPLPQTEISSGEYPNLFPSPPSPLPPESEQQHMAAPRDAGPVLEEEPEELQLRRHAARLCSEEESWYYYLTEIALRRIGNRIINTFFRPGGRSAWLDIKPLLRMAREFEAQVSSWSAHLPPVMQHYETTSMIRAPTSSFLDDDGDGDGVCGCVSRELSWAIDNRLLEMQTWLYQPFLYYLVHVGVPLGPGPGPAMTHPATVPGTLPSNPSAAPPPSGGPTPAATPLDADDVAVLTSLITSGIDCCLRTIDVRSRGHRHHGLWFDLRSIMCAALVLLAVARSGNVAWIPGGAACLWGPGCAPAAAAEPDDHPPPPIGGRIGRVLAQFDFWAAEAPDMLWYKSVLEAVGRDVRGF